MSATGSEWRRFNGPYNGSRYSHIVDLACGHNTASGCFNFSAQNNTVNDVDLCTPSGMNDPAKWVGSSATGREHDSFIINGGAADLFEQGRLRNPVPGIGAFQEQSGLLKLRIKND